MELKVKVLGVDIETVRPDQPSSVYDGKIRIIIYSSDDSGFEPIETSVTFQHGVGLTAGITKALGSLHEYGNALALAADEAARTYR